MAKTIMLGRANNFSLLLLAAAAIPIVVHCKKETQPMKITSFEYSGPTTNWDINGKVVQKRAWIESGDTNVLVISEVKRGEPWDSAYISALYGYHFARRSGEWKRLWRIQEHNRSTVEIVAYDSASLKIIDVDGNGQAETLFFYSAGFDSGTEPLIQKMMFHWNGIKAPIRGKIPRTTDDSIYYEKTLDPQLRTAPAQIQDFAVGEWKRFIKANFEDLINNP